MTGDMNFGMDIGVLGAISAYAKGGPVRIVSSEMVGTPDVFWYVRSDSRLKSVKDISGAQIAYSRPGSRTNMTLLTLASFMKLTPKLASTGGISGTRTQVMSGRLMPAGRCRLSGSISSGRARRGFCSAAPWSNRRPMFRSGSIS